MFELRPPGEIRGGFFYGGCNPKLLQSGVFKAILISILILAVYAKPSAADFFDDELLFEATRDVSRMEAEELDLFRVYLNCAAIEIVAKPVPRYACRKVRADYVNRYGGGRSVDRMIIAIDDGESTFKKLKRKNAFAGFEAVINRYVTVIGALKQAVENRQASLK